MAMLFKDAECCAQAMEVELKEQLRRYLVTDFSVHVKNSGKCDVLEAYNDALSSEKLIDGLYGKLKTLAVSDKQLWEFSKHFKLPIGLSHRLVRDASTFLYSLKKGHLLVDSICIVEIYEQSSHFKVIHADWNCFLVARVCSITNIAQCRPRSDTWISLGFHSHIVTAYFYRIHRENDRFCLFVQHIDGALSLKHFLDIQSGTEGTDVSSIVRSSFRTMISLCRAIDHCHVRGCPHLCICPENVLMVSDNQSVSADWNVMITGFELSSTERDCDSIYVAPELAYSDEALPVADVYSLSMVFLDIIRGRTLYPKEIEAYLRCDDGTKHENGADYDLPPHISAMVDAAFAESCLPTRRIYPLLPVIESGLRANPDLRPSVREMLEQLHDAHKYTTLAPTLPPPPPAVASESPENMSNLAWGEMEVGCLESAREHWIGALASNPADLVVLWNLTLCRWRCGEIGPAEAVGIIRRHQMQFVSPFSVQVHASSDSADHDALCSTICSESLLSPISGIGPLLPTSEMATSCAYIWCSGFTPAEALMYRKMQMFCADDTSLVLSSHLTRCRLEYDASLECLVEHVRERPGVYHSSHCAVGSGMVWLNLDPDIETIEVGSYDDPHDGIVLLVGEVMQYNGMCLFVERAVDGVCSVPGLGETVLCVTVYVLLEGRWAYDEFGNEGGENMDDLPSVVGYDEDSYSSPSSQSETDTNLTPAPPRRHYFLAVGNLRESCFYLEGICAVWGINPDQRPVRLQLISPELLLVSGSGGLLAHASPPHEIRGVPSIRIVHMSSDPLLQPHIHPDRLSASHSVSSTVVDSSYSPGSRTLISGDSQGTLCLWKKDSEESDVFTLVGKPLSLCGRIYRIVQSEQSVHALVSLDMQLLLVSASVGGVTCNLHVRSILDAVPPGKGLSPQYVARFTGKTVSVWRVSTQTRQSTVNTTSKYSLKVEFMSVPNAEYFSHSKERCTFRFMPVESYRNIMSKKATLRTLNERLFHLVNTDDFEYALDDIMDCRKCMPSLRFNSEVLTWYMSISEKSALSVGCDSQNRTVKFIPTDSLDSCRSPTVTSDIEMLSAISASMQISVSGPVFPFAVSSNGFLIATSARSKIAEATGDTWKARNNHCNEAHVLLLAVRIYCLSNRKLLYTMDFNDLFLGFDACYPCCRSYKRLESIYIVSALSFSCNGKVLLVAVDRQNCKVSSLILWCCQERKCIGRMDHTDGSVIEAKWSHSDTLLTVFFSDEKFLTYFLDWPVVKISHTTAPANRWLTLRGICATSDSMTDEETCTSGGSPNDIYVNNMSNSDVDTYQRDTILRSGEYFDSLCMTSMDASTALPTPASSMLNKYADMKQWAVRSIEAWVRACDDDVTGGTLYVPRSVHSVRASRVCIVHGAPFSGKSVILSRAALECSPNVLASVFIPRHRFKSSSPNSIAFDMICAISQQLRIAYGSRYTIPMLHELSNEVQRLSEVSGGALRNTNICRGASRHSRNFSVASSLGSLESNTFVEEDITYDNLLLCTCRALRLTTDEATALMTPIAIIPDIKRLSLRTLFVALISKPLSELPAPRGNAAIFVDGLDICDSSSTYTHAQCVVDLLIHSTPPWCRIVLSSRHSPIQIPVVQDVESFGVHLDREGTNAADMFSLCKELLREKGLKGDVLSSARTIFSAAEMSLRQVELLHSVLPDSLTPGTLRRTLCVLDLRDIALDELFSFPSSEKFQRAQRVLQVLCAAFESPTVQYIADALQDMTEAQVGHIIEADLYSFFEVMDCNNTCTVVPRSSTFVSWVRSGDRLGHAYYINPQEGHNYLCALYLKHCSNKSIAMDHPWQAYLKTYGPSHLHRSSRGLCKLTRGVRKLDETSGIKGPLPHQIGYLENIQEIYARRVGIYGPIPKEFGCLRNMRVLSMGNNRISGHIPSTLGNLRNLQRIVLHQNKLSGPVPPCLWELGCIVNLAGNSGLQHGPDVPPEERGALEAIYRSTDGGHWACSSGWCEEGVPVCKWYKVGVLGSRVHSIVMSSNNMVGTLPTEISRLSHLRMVELATMPGLCGQIGPAVCALTGLRRLCICRCSLTGRIPHEIGNLTHLEELQLFGNNLNGRIPDSVSNLTSLRLLSLGEYTGGNSFTPSHIPSCLSSLVRLEALFMANCHLRGPLPDWIGGLVELRQLDLQRNNLRGVLPHSIGMLTNILYLNLKDNADLQGPLPIQQLTRLTKLNRLSLVHCRFTVSEEEAAELQTRLPRCRLWI